MSLLVDVEKNFGAFKLKISFEAGRETLALLGASGCGKSMTLRCIAGIIKPDKGKIILNGVTLFDFEKKINLPPQKRNCGLMFQNYALFPQMTVEENILAGAVRFPKNLRREKLNDMLKIFELEDLRIHYPSQLSGGQQQRTALARMLISEPKVLMLDEPFSALDSHLRFQTEHEVRRVIKNFNGPVLLVSHDRDEVFRMSDKIAVMSGGCIDVIGSRHEVFTNPKTRTAAILTGCKNISRAEKISANEIYASDWGIKINLPLKENTRFIGIRMHDIICAEKSHTAQNIFTCKISEIIENSFSFTLMLTAKDGHKKIGWEFTKEEFKKFNFKNDFVKISLPIENILQLTD